ncbi:MAG TPA: hypothetical protein VNA17_08300 [Pyrinomonadaceae bacterium]|nr:hypothetical protein [Pyrinomonadaceae bacterium]
MFEQSFYNTEPAPAPGRAPSEKGELFRDYEIKNWELSPRIYKILGLAAAANLLAVLIVAQTSLLTMKGCDSPLVGQVCQALDVIYVGSALFGTEREYIDAVYDKTELEDAEITFVDVSGETGPLYYPSDYLKYSDPERYAAQQELANNPIGTVDNFAGFPPGFSVTTPSPGNSVIDTPPVYAQPNPNVVDGNLPSFSGNSGVASAPPRRNRGRGRVVKSPVQSVDGTPDEDTVAETKPAPDAKTDPKPSPDASPETPATEEAKEDKFGVYINKRPMTDQATKTLEQVGPEKVRLDTPFKVTISGTLGLAKDGKTIVLKNPKPIPPPNGFKNDPKMEKLVQDWILAVGDAGWLGYLDKVVAAQKLKPKRVIVTVEQTDSVLTAKVTAEQPSENEAKTYSSGLNTLLGLAAGQTDGDEQMFLKSATTTAEGKLLVLNFNIPKPIVQEMIQRKLAASKPEPARPNGSNNARPSVDNSAR